MRKLSFCIKKSGKRFRMYPGKGNRPFGIVFFFLAMLVILHNCEKLEPEHKILVSTDTISDIRANSCLATATLLDTGGGNIDQHGFCWSSTHDPTVDMNSTSLGPRSTSGEFSDTLTGLAENSLYYVRAYATVGDIVTYGNELSFTTLSADLPVVETAPVTGITPTSAISGGTVVDDGGGSISVKGVCFNTTGDPDIEDRITNEGVGSGPFTSSMTELSPNTTYYVRAYATNPSGTGYGNLREFKTTVAGTDPVADFSASDYTPLQGQNVQFTDLSSGNPSSWSWNFGDGGSSTLQNPSHSYSELGTYTVSLTVTNDYSSDTETKTNYIAVGAPPVADFTVSDTLAAVGQSIQFTDLSANQPVEWFWNFGDGNTSAISNPSYIYTGTGIFTVSLTVTNEHGYDSKQETDYIYVWEMGTVSDNDGHTYKTVKIGDQWWMAENLNTTRYSTGLPITLVEDNTAWSSLGDTEKARCYNENSSANGDTYGMLYTWAAAMNGQASSSSNPSGVQGVCPSGWHLPSDAEWKELEMYLGMTQAEADKENMRGVSEGSKLAGNVVLWKNGDLRADPDFGTSGFTALPGGYRFDYGTFSTASGSRALFWTATEKDADGAYDRYLYWSTEEIYRNEFNKSAGASVRCVKN